MADEAERARSDDSDSNDGSESGSHVQVHALCTPAVPRPCDAALCGPAQARGEGRRSCEVAWAADLPPSLRLDGPQPS